MYNYIFQSNKKKFFKRSELLQTPETEQSPSTSNVNIVNNSSSRDDYTLIDENSTHSIVPRTEVIRKLRERGHPILLFAESEIDAFKRLRKMEILQPELNKVCYTENRDIIFF